ncbi:MAG: hypothetical protein JWM19_6410 [Actinomycetia bacterium]|nr:hypothetical protein [Actinomycetes bacterium]
MKRPAARVAGGRRGCAAVAIMVLAGCAAGCGQAASHQASPNAPVVAPSLNTSLATTAGTWASVVMGDAGSSDNAFSQLFTRPAGSTGWKLVTPPGVATNGGFVLATQGNQALIAGFRPGVDLTFSALTATRDNGTTWQPGSPLQPGLADVPDALAAAPSGRMLALLIGGTLTQSGDDGTHWSALSNARSLAETAAGRRCSPAGLTAVSFTPTGAPLAAATCTRPGITGIFSYTAGSWQAAGPSLPAPLADAATGVLRLTGTPAGNEALLVAGTGTAASLLAARTSDDGAHWAVSAPLRLGAAAVRSSGFGDGGAAWAVLTDGRAETISGQAAAWRALPAVPQGTAALAPGTGGGFDALAVSGSKLTVWRLSPGTTAWTTAQVINVPIEYGSS